MYLTYDDIINENIDTDQLVNVLNNIIDKNNKLIQKIFPSEIGYPFIKSINRVEVEGNLLDSDNYGKDKIRLTIWGKDIHDEDIVGDTHTIKPEDFPE